MRGRSACLSFNTQPPEGGWRRLCRSALAGQRVSTHSRPKAAGFRPDLAILDDIVSTHSRPKAAGYHIKTHLDNLHMFQHTAARRRLDVPLSRRAIALLVSTHSRPKAAGAHARHAACGLGVSTHSRPKAAGACLRPPRRQNLFQHTAARRRLGPRPLGRLLADAVSTHSRPKAAGAEFGCGGVKLGGFNTQPPEGGWRPECDYRGRVSKFQHTAARRRLDYQRLFV